MTPRAVLTKFAVLQMVGVHLPTTDGRHLVLPHYTPPEQNRRLLLKKLRLELLPQPPPRIQSSADPST